MKTKTKEKSIKVGILYNAFDPTQMQYSELVYRPNTQLKTYLHDLPDDCEWKIGLNGQPVTLETHGKVKLKPTDTVQLVVVPRGGGAKNILRMVAMVAIVVGAAVLFGPGGALAFSVMGSASAGMALGMALFTLAGGLLINALLPPKPPKIDDADSSSYGYDGAKNTAREGVALPVVYGKYRVAGNYVNVYTENVNDDQYLYGRTILSDGVIENVSEPYLNDQPIANYSEVKWGWRAGTPTETLNEYFSRNISQVNKNIKLNGTGEHGTGSSTLSWTTHTTTEEVSQFSLNFLFPKGLVHITKKKGKKENRSTAVAIQYRKQGDTAWINWPTTTSSIPASIGWLDIVRANTSNQIIWSDKRVKQLRKTVESPILEPAIYEIRVAKSDEEGDQERDIDELYLADVGEITTQPVNLRHVANAYYRIKMSEQLNGIPNITWLVEGVKVNKYDINGNVTVKEWTDNPAWIVLDMLIGEERGFPNIYNIDFPAFIEWAEWCEDEGLKFNGVFDSTTTLWDACVDVLKIGHAAFTRVGTKLSLAIDKPKQPVMLFGPGNIYKDTFAINYLSMNERANELELSYFDKEDLNQQKTLRIVDPDANARGDMPRAVAYSMPGIDNFEQAQKEIWYQLYNNRYLRRTITFDAPVESIGLGIGDVALIQHDVVDWGTSGRIKSASSNSTITLDRPITMEDDNDYSLLVIFNNLNRATGTIVSTLSNTLTINSISNTSISTSNVKRLVQGGIDREVIGLNVVGTTAYVTIAGDNDFVNGPVTFVDTDVIEERDVVYSAGEHTSVSVTGGFSAVPATYSNFMFGVKEIVKKPYRLKGMSGTGFDQRKLTFVEYNEAIYNPPEMIVPFPATTEPKTVKQVTGVAFAHDQYATYDNANISGILSWQASHIKDYGGADVYIAVNGGNFTFLQTVFNTNEYHINVVNDTDVVVKVVAFNGTLTRALSTGSPTLSLTIDAIASELDPPHDLDVTQVSYIATALVQLTWEAPVGLSAGDLARIRYRVQVQPDGEEIWDEYGVTDQQLIRIGDLTVGTHLFRVRAEIGTSASEWASIGFTTFTTEETLQNGDSDLVPPATPTGLGATSSITDNGAKLTFTWTPPADTDLAGYVLAVKEGASGNFIEFMTTTAYHEIDGLKRNQIYYFKVKAFDDSGNYGAFTAESNQTTAVDSVPPALPTSITATASFQNIYLKWTNPADADLAGIYIFENTVNNLGTATYLTSVNAIPSNIGGFTRNGLASGVTRYYWLKSFDTSGNESAATSVTSATTASVSEADFTPTASNIAPIVIVSALPTTGNYVGRTVYLTTDGKLYRCTNASGSGTWTSSTATTDLTGTIAAAQFANSLRPVEVLGALPTTGNFVGRMVFLTTDNKLYRCTNAAGSGTYSASVPTTDLTGTINTAQIADAALTTAKFAAGITPVEIVAALPTTGNFVGRTVILTADNKLYRCTSATGSGTWTASVPAADITGTLNNSQLAAIDAAKVTGQIVGTQITDGAISTAKIAAGAITSNEIAANTIVAGDIAAGTITSTQIAADTITASNIAANAITSSELAANAVTAGKINAGAVTATEIAANSVIASKLALIDTNNMVADPSFSDTAYWTLQTYTVLTGDTLNTTLGAVNIIRSTTGNGTTSQTFEEAYVANTRLTVEGGKPYRIAVKSLVPAGFTGRTRIMIRWYKQDQTNASTANTSVFGGDYRTVAATVETVTSIDGVVTAPSDAYYARFSLYTDWSTTLNNAGRAYYANPRMMRAANAELIVDGTITASKIAADTITANEIAANAITSNELAANSVIAGKVQAGAISTNELAANAVTAAKIAADSVTASKLYVGDTSNMVPDPTMTDLTSWVLSGAGSMTSVGTVQAGTGSGYKLVAASNNGDVTISSDWIYVEENKPYYFKTAVGSDTGASVTLRTYVDWYSMNAAGAVTYISGNEILSPVVTTTTVQFAALTITAPTNAKVAIIRGHKLVGATGQLAMYSPIMRRANNGELIVDGTITAAKIAADTITAGNIAAGAIGASEVAAGAITASKLAISGENLFPDPQCQDWDWWHATGQLASVGAGYTSPANNSNAYATGWVLETNPAQSGILRVGGSKGYWTLWSNSGAAYVGTGYTDIVAPTIIVKNSTTYEFGCGCYNSSNRAQAINVQYYRTDGSFHSGTTLWTVAANSNNGTVQRNKFTTPSDVVAVRFYFSNDGSGTAFNGLISIGNFTLREAASGTMIVDGSITAAHITANTITGDKIAANTINADRILSSSSLPASLLIGTTGYTLSTQASAVANSGNFNSINPTFGLWGSTYPDNFAVWDASGTIVKTTGEIYTNAYRCAVGGNNGGIVQHYGNGHAPWIMKPNSWIVIEAEIKLNSGVLTSSGMLLRGAGTAETMIQFSVDKDTAGAVVGAGTVGTTYRFKKLVWTGSGSNVGSEMYLMTAWNGFGSTATARDITWYKAGWRYASTAEIDPAAQINGNGASTLIDPGKITISGGVKLSDWRYGGDTTQINGGSIAANTITANKLTVGLRAISFIGLNFEWNPSNNYVYWSEGYIYYTNDAGTAVTQNIVAGNSGGVAAHRWFYWTPGTNYIQMTQTDGLANNANNIFIGAWWGGSNLNINYGGTIIHGDRITTNTISANKIVSGSIFTQTLYVGNTNIVLDGPNARIIISD